MTTLVTGAAGFVGQHLLRDLLLAGEEVAGATLDGHPPEPGPLAAEDPRAVRWISLDVTSSDSVKAALDEVRPGRVYHLAAQSSVGESFRHPLETWTVNATGTFTLLEALVHSERPVRFLLPSSAEVYGPVPEREQPISEDRPLSPVTPYAASKAAAEMAARAATRSSLVEPLVARGFNHTGPGQNRRFALPGFARQLVEQRGSPEPVLKTGNLEVRRDFLDVRDVVRAYRLLMERGEPGRAYNVCSGRAYSLAELCNRLVEVSGVKARVLSEPRRRRSLDLPLLVGDPSRLRALGWEPEISLDRTLEELIRGVERGWT